MKLKDISLQVNTLLSNIVVENRRKVSFDTASDAYILSGQNFIKIAQNGQFGEFLQNLSLWSNIVTRLGQFQLD